MGALPYLVYTDLYGYVPLNRVWFSGSLVLNRVYNIVIISHVPTPLYG